MGPVRALINGFIGGGILTLRNSRDSNSRDLNPGGPDFRRRPAMPRFWKSRNGCIACIFPLPDQQHGPIPQHLPQLEQAAGCSTAAPFPAGSAWRGPLLENSRRASGPGRRVRNHRPACLAMAMRRVIRLKGHVHPECRHHHAHQGSKAAGGIAAEDRNPQSRSRPRARSPWRIGRYKSAPTLRDQAQHRTRRCRRDCRNSAQSGVCPGPVRRKPARTSRYGPEP